MVCEAQIMRVSLTKMHGARNDFVILDQRREPLSDLVSFARWACDRHAGVGADGLIALESSNRADLRMHTINPDGTDAEMCGNGVRCAARWLDEAGEGDRVEFETDAGLITTEVVARGPEYLVRVAVGRPRVDSRVLPNGASFVDVGNPHVVIFVADVEDVDLGALAAKVQDESVFPEGTNVHVVAPVWEHALRARHWERGVGLTMACGTGAVACAAVAREKKLVPSSVEVLVPGGRLVVEWDAGGEAYLVGPAVRVFDTKVRV
jgi:diaminopimelate epimerase